MAINMQTIQAADKIIREHVAMEAVFATIEEFFDDNSHPHPADLVEQIKPALAYVCTDPEDRIAWLLVFLALHMHGELVFGHAEPKE